MNKLSADRFDKLQAGLLDGFTPFTLRQMVRIQLDEGLERIALGESYAEIVFSLVEWAERSDRVDELVQAAHRANPGNPSLRRLAEEIDAAASPPTPPLSFDWRPVRAGVFLMGSSPRTDHAAAPFERPQHEVYLPFFRIARTPVTNAQYEVFVDAVGYRVPEHWIDGQVPAGKEHHPVTHVSLEDALAFCQWAGVRLPTEAEWEKAARGTEGRLYPWGNEPPDPARANFAGRIGDTAPVDAHPHGCSPYSCLDMAGNVWEWTASLWGAERSSPAFLYPYRADDGRETIESDLSLRRVLRGGSHTRGPRLIRCAARYSGMPGYRHGLYGFRVVAIGSLGSRSV